MVDGREVLAALRAEASRRILVLDGAMGTEIQNLELDETHFRAHDALAACNCLLKGNNDLLTLTQPDAIREIHLAYPLAGADILETNTFSSTSIAQADYGMEAFIHELNRAARRARARGGGRGRGRDGRRRFVAGALGPDQPHRLDLAAT